MRYKKYRTSVAPHTMVVQFGYRAFDKECNITSKYNCGFNSNTELQSIKSDMQRNGNMKSVSR